MRRINSNALLLVVVVFSLCLANAAQSVDETKKKPSPIRFSEVGDVGDCDFRTAVRAFFSELSNHPGYQGYIINYAPERDDIAHREGLITRLISFRNFDRSRITLVRGGYRAAPATEFWLIPPGADLPPVTSDGPEQPSAPKVRPYVARDFEPYTGEVVLAEFVYESIRKQEEAEDKEREEPRASVAGDLTEEPLGDPVSKEEPGGWRNNERFRWADVDIATNLARTKGTTGLIIFYADDRRYDIAKLTRFVDQGRDLLVKDARIKVSRLRVQFGGYREEANVEFWVIPPNGSDPIPKPEERCKESDESPG